MTRWILGAALAALTPSSIFAAAAAPQSSAIETSFAPIQVVGTFQRVSVQTSMRAKRVLLLLENPRGDSCGDPQACPEAYTPFEFIQVGPHDAHIDYWVPGAENEIRRFAIVAIPENGSLAPVYDGPFSVQILEANRSGKTYFVDRNHPAANDGNSGSENLPWRTIRHAARQARAGDTVLIKAGIYADGDVVVYNSGTKDQEIVFAAYPGHEHQAVIQGGGFISRGKSHLYIHGLKVQQSSRTGFWFEGPGAEGIRLIGCYTYDTRSSGVAVWGVDWGKDPGNYDNIKDVVIEDNLIELATNGGYNETITVANGASNILVKNNILRKGGTLGLGLGDEGIDFKEGVRDSAIVKNRITGLKHNAIYIDAGSGHGNYSWRPAPVMSNIHIVGNEVWNSEAHGISITTEGRGHVDGIYVYNNLVHGMENNGFLVYDHPQGRSEGGTIQNVSFVNNTAVRNGWDYGGGFRIDHDRATGILIRNNIAWNNYAYDIRGERGTIIEANMARDAGWNLGNPQFVDSNGDFRLQSNSPAIDRGISTGYVLRDKDATRRPVNLGWDLGCYEWEP